MTLDIRSSEYRRNPYPAFRRLRAEAPVCRIAPHGHWAVARHADVLGILKHPGLFLSSGLAPDLGEKLSGPEFLLRTRGMIDCDPPAHTRLRGLVNRAMTPGMVSALTPRIRSLCDELVTALERRGTFDFIADFAMPLPITVISELMGIDPDRKEDFKRWSDTLITWRNTAFIEDGELRAAREKEIGAHTNAMFEYFDGIIRERAHRPRPDLVSALVQACDADRKLTPREVLGFVRLLLVAGNETTTNLLGNTVLALLSHPEQWALVQGDRSLVGNLVEESLRYDSPAVALLRRAASDTTIAGVRIAAGELVLPLLASANHDEGVFANAHRFDVRRDTKGHLAFGAGIHFCLGAPLARLQARLAFEALLDRFHSLHDAGTGPPERIDSFWFRGARALPLTAVPRG